MDRFGFEYNIISDVDYEDLVVDIMYDDVNFVTVNQEMGYKLLKMRFFTPYEKPCWLIPLEEFLSVLNKSRKELWDYRMIDTPEEWEHQHEDYRKEIVAKVKSDLEGKKRAELYLEQKLMGTLIDVRGILFLKVYPNLDKEQVYGVSQWDVFVKDFEDVINETKAALTSE